MKTKKIMFVIAGIINSLIGGITLLLSIIMLLLKSAVATILKTGDACQELVDELIDSDASYEFLNSYSIDQVVDFVWGMLSKVLIFAIAISMVLIMFAIFNFIFSKKCEQLLSRKKAMGTVLVVFSWLIMTFNIANVFTTLGVYLKGNSNDKNVTIITPPTDGRGYSRF